MQGLASLHRTAEGGRWAQVRDPEGSKCTSQEAEGDQVDGSRGPPWLVSVWREPVRCRDFLPSKDGVPTEKTKHLQRTEGLGDLRAKDRTTSHRLGKRCTCINKVTNAY